MGDAATQPGWILAAARADQRATAWLGLILLALSTAFLAWNGDVLYNAARGPFDFTEDVAANPGRRQWIRSAGIVLPTGLEQQSTLKLLKGLVSSTSVTAKYLAQPKLGKILVVKVRTDSTVDPVVGELVPLPTAVQAELASLVPGERLHPYLLDATHEYFSMWSFYGLVLAGAGLMAMLSLGLLIYGLVKLAPENHEELIALAKLGSPAAVAARIESDISRAGVAGVAGPFRHTATWLVAKEPLLRIVRAEDLVAFAPAAEGTQKNPAFSIHVFRRGGESPLKVNVVPSEFASCLTSLTARFPWALEKDAVVFARRWSSERPACEKDAIRKRAEILQPPTRPAPASAS